LTQRSSALALIVSAQFVLQLDFSIVNVALPTMLRELRIPPAELQWIVTGYGLAFGSLLLAGGRAADVFGRRRMFSIGLTVFAVASLGCGLAQSTLLLSAARIVLGAAGPLPARAALSLLTTMFDEGPERNRALGIWQAVTAGGALAGIIAGGLLTQYFGWRSIFLINPPVIACMLALTPRLLPKGQGESAHIDAPGAILLTASLAALILGLTNGEEYGFASSLTLGALAVAALSAIGFAIIERAAREPMLPRGILAAPTRRGALDAMLLIGAIVAAYVYFVSLYLQGVEGFSPAITGLALVPSVIVVMLTSTFATRKLLDKVGVKALLLIGLLALAAGQLCLTQVSGGGGYFEVVLPGLLFSAFGMGLALPTASIALTSGVVPRDQGLAGALFVTGQQVGGAIGLAVLATIAAARTEHMHGSREAGYGASFLVSTGFALVAMAIVAARFDSRACQEELQRRKGVRSE
jgi:MFS family permease